MDYGHQAADSLPEEHRLSSVSAELSRHRERLAQSTVEIGSIADRLLGTRPEPALTGNAKGHPQVGGSVLAINNELEWLCSEIEALEERVKRLSQL
jgi:hypothetical protein